MRRYFLFAVIVLVLLVVPIWFAFGRQKTAKSGDTGVDIQVVPNGATIVVEGRRVKEGFTKTAVGNTRITVTRPGFAQEEQLVAVSAGEVRFVGFALTPNSPETMNWYEAHPADKKEAEGLSSKNFDDTSQKAVVQQPFIKDLPYIGPAEEYRIDYGPDPSGKTSEQVIFITATSQETRTKALNWIRNQGYDPSKMTIIYK